jgi:hypothetical protein
LLFVLYIVRAALGMVVMLRVEGVILATVAVLSWIVVALVLRRWRWSELWTSMLGRTLSSPGAYGWLDRLADGGSCLDLASASVGCAERGV